MKKDNSLTSGVVLKRNAILCGGMIKQSLKGFDITFEEKEILHGRRAFKMLLSLGPFHLICEKENTCSLVTMEERL